MMTRRDFFISTAALAAGCRTSGGKAGQPASQFNNNHSVFLSDVHVSPSVSPEDSYQLALKSFGNGSIDMTKLDQIKQKRDSALSSYLSNVASFWSSYFGIRKATLFDYITGTDISAEFDKLVE